MSQESQELLAHAARTLQGFGAMPRQVSLLRESSTDLTPAQAAAALQSLANQANSQAPLLGWWQQPDCVVHTAQREAPILPDETAMEILLEGEWTCGNTTLQLRRCGNTLRQSLLVELSPNTQVPVKGDRKIDMQPAMAQTHALLGRADLNIQTMEVVVYSMWDAQRQQVIPVAQRLLTLSNV
jgi:hypothetical protein